MTLTFDHQKQITLASKWKFVPYLKGVSVISYLQEWDKFPNITFTKGVPDVKRSPQGEILFLKNWDRRKVKVTN